MYATGIKNRFYYIPTQPKYLDDKAESSDEAKECYIIESHI